MNLHVISGFFCVVRCSLSLIKQPVNSENYGVGTFCCSVSKNIEHTEPKVLWHIL